MKTIAELIQEFEMQSTITAEDRITIVNDLIVRFGYDKVSEAMGLKVSTLNQVVRTNNASSTFSDKRVRQALYVFSNLQSE